MPQTMPSEPIARTFVARFPSALRKTYPTNEEVCDDAWEAVCGETDVAGPSGPTPAA